MRLLQLTQVTALIESGPGVAASVGLDGLVFDRHLGASRLRQARRLRPVAHKLVRRSVRHLGPKQGLSASLLRPQSLPGELRLLLLCEVRRVAKLQLEVFQLSRLQAVRRLRHIDLVEPVPLAEVQVAFALGPGRNLSGALLLRLGRIGPLVKVLGLARGVSRLDELEALAMLLIFADEFLAVDDGQGSVEVIPSLRHGLLGLLILLFNHAEHRHVARIFLEDRHELQLLRQAVPLRLPLRQLALRKVLIAPPLAL